MQDTLIDMLDQMLELIYIVDIENYEIIYMNSSGQKKYGIGDLNEAKYFRLIQGYEKPCAFCINNIKNMSIDKVYSQEFTSELLNKQFHLTDKLAIWNGRKVHIHIAADITEQESDRRALQNNLEAERIIRDCISLLYDAKSLSEAMDAVLRQTGKCFGADRAYFFQPAKDTLIASNEWRASYLPPDVRVKKLRISDFRRWWLLYDLQECVVIDDLEQTKGLDLELYQAFQRQGIKNLVAMPLVQDGKLVGLWGVENPSLEKINGIASLLLSLRYFLLSTMHRIEYEAALVKLSFEDALTGFRNRNCYLQDIARFKDDKSTAIVCININNMKGINDMFGHEYGDRILMQCARNIEQCFDAAALYRIGGDEFVVICKDITYEKCRQNVNSFKKQCLTDSEYQIAIGYHWLIQTEDIQRQILAAEAWMYEDKKLFYRKNLPSDRYRHYNDDVFGLGELEVLKQRLNEGRFIIYLQPKISFADRQVSGAEALVRYCADDGTIITPIQFLPVLEDARLIGWLDFFVFDLICIKLSEWIREGRKTAPISVNFSRYTLAEPYFLEQLRSVYAKYDIDKKWIVIEITESVKGVEGMNLLSLIDSIRDAGFAIAIDDFGVDYTNLSLFASANFDELKVDKSLVDNIAVNEKTQMIIEAVVEICRKMNIRVVAEGVETEEQFKILRENGCNQAQGYLFSKPIPMKEYEEIFLPII